MNIVINAVLAFEKPRGVGRYINNLLSGLADIDKENEYYVYYGKWMAEYEFLRISKSNFHFIELDIKNNQLTRNLYLALWLPIIIKKHRPHFLFLIDTQAMLIKTCPILSTIHDLAEFEVPEKYSKKQGLLRRMIVKNQIRISDKIMTVSNYSKNDICCRFGVDERKIQVTYNSVETLENVEIIKPQNYILFVSETEKAKNLITLLKAYTHLPEIIKNHLMIKVVGKKGNDYENILSFVEQNCLEKVVEFYGYVSEEDLNRLYKNAYVFVFPSLFEGFGLPVLEAMAKGVPVICSNSSSIPEVGGECVMTFNPKDDNELSKLIQYLFENDEVRLSMIRNGIERARKFSKINAANETLNVFKTFNKE